MQCYSPKCFMCSLCIVYVHVKSTKKISPTFKTMLHITTSGQNLHRTPLNFLCCHSWDRNQCFCWLQKTLPLVFLLITDLEDRNYCWANCKNNGSKIHHCQQVTLHLGSRLFPHWYDALSLTHTHIVYCILVIHTRKSAFCCLMQNWQTYTSIQNVWCYFVTRAVCIFADILVKTSLILKQPPGLGLKLN